MNRMIEPAGGLDLVEHGLQALLELAAIFRAGDQRAHVERHQLLVLQAFRHVAIDDAQGEAFGDGGLADAGFADQDGIVLGAARQDLDRAADLVVAADHRVELALARIGGQVAGIFLQRVIGLFGAGAVGGAALADVVDRLVEAGRRDAGLGEDVRGLGRFLHRQREQQALDGDIAVAGLPGDFLGGVHDLGERLGHVELAVAALHLRLGVERGLDAETDIARLAAGALDQRRGEALRIVDQDFQNVFGRELLMVLPERESLGRLNETTDAVGIFLKIHFGLQSTGQPWKALAGSSMTGSRFAANPCSLDMVTRRAEKKSKRRPKSKNPRRSPARVRIMSSCRRRFQTSAATDSPVSEPDSVFSDAVSSGLGAACAGGAASAAGLTGWRPVPAARAQPRPAFRR
jgi:hypothetical protein